jgi:membrane protein implicated in regulation of membrane protease activity
MTPNKLPFLMIAAIGLVIVVLIGLATGSWLWFGIVLAVHLIASAIVLTGAFRSARTGNETDPRSERLDRRAHEAVGDKPGGLEAELEALKREPSSN